MPPLEVCPAHSYYKSLLSLLVSRVSISRSSFKFENTVILGREAVTPVSSVKLPTAEGTFPEVVTQSVARRGVQYW